MFAANGNSTVHYKPDFPSELYTVRSSTAGKRQSFVKQRKSTGASRGGTSLVKLGATPVQTYKPVTCTANACTHDR